MRTLRKLLSEQGGSVAVEFALILPVILMLMFTVIELGTAWYYKQMLVNATREGARLAVMQNDGTNTSSQVTSLVSNYLATAGYPATVTVTATGADGNAGDTVQVSATSDYQMPVLSKLVPDVLSTVTLSASTVMRHE